MNQWLFDLGNTRLKCARLGIDGRPGEVVALDHSAADLGAALDAALPARFDVAHVASVASDALRIALLDALSARCARIALARSQPAFAGVRIAYAQPRRLGVDRFLALLAARARGGAALVCGVGTALTIDLVDAEGHHHGGRIAPSPTLMRESLHARAPQLPVAGGAYADFADDTVDALVSGCDGAAVALIEVALRDATQRLGAAPVLLLHGGGAQALRAHLPSAVWAPSLVLEGLAAWVATCSAPAHDPH